VSSGVCFDEHSDGFVHLVLVKNRQHIRQAVCNIKAFLAAYD